MDEKLAELLGKIGGIEAALGALPDMSALLEALPELLAMRGKLDEVSEMLGKLMPSEPEDDDRDDMGAGAAEEVRADSVKVADVLDLHKVATRLEIEVPADVTLDGLKRSIVAKVEGGERSDAYTADQLDVAIGFAVKVAAKMQPATDPKPGPVRTGKRSDAAETVGNQATQNAPTSFLSIPTPQPGA